MFHRFAGKKGLGWLVLQAVLGLLLAACDSTAPTATPTVEIAQDTAKVDTILRDLLVTYQSGGLTAARDYARNVGLLDDQDRIRFGLTLSNSSAAAPITVQILKMGGEVYASTGDQLGVAIDLNRLTTYFNTSDKRNFFQELASFKEVRELKLLLRPALSTLPDPNEGAGVIGADRWQRAGFNGQGIQVGIIDGGFATYKGFLGTALPAASQVELKSFLLGDGEGSDNHGVAVAEVVHSLAPEAKLILAPIEDEIGFTRAVQYFIDRKVQIMQISLGWAGIFPGDGTGKMDEKLDEARRAGVLPVVSAGNYGLAHYLNTFQPDETGFQHFSNNRTTLKLTAEAGSAWVSLHWEESWTAPKTNLDLYILDAAGKPLVSSRNEQGLGDKPPTELAPFRTSPGQTYYIQVKLAGGPLPAGLKFHLFAYNAHLDEATAQSSVATPGDARGALSVGATSWRKDEVETYSSRGPTLDGRAKPEIMAPTGITSLVFKGTFAGTSASTPQVAGAAALVWSAAREMTADQVAVYLARNTLDLGSPGRDPETGFGRVRLGPEEAARRGLIDLLGATPNGPTFEDNFQDRTSGLPDNALGHYTGQAAYQVQAQGGQVNWNSYLNRSFEEFRASVNVTPLPGDTGLFYGLVFWQQAPDDYYVWLISGTRYTLMRRSGKNWAHLIDWSQDAALLPDSQGQATLVLEATGSYVRLQANATVLQSIFLKPQTPTAPPVRLGGKFGLMAGQFIKAAPQTVLYRNLIITPLTIK